ncbi:hypothetical protein [Winogradskyella sp.]|uniref:hypothetical protein n=1 Tax=Winogradskyella sp. TaxID=1883156 RepID=UPI003F6C6FFC
MKNPAKTSIIVIATLVLLVFLFFKACVIYHPKPSECETVTVKIAELREGPTYDIQFKAANGQTFYINRGIESGLNLDSLNAKVLNKTVTLHLPKMIYGPSKHIAQLALKDEVIYTEFKD